VTNTGSDRAQLANIASRAKDAIGVDKLQAVADRGYYSGEEILNCDKAGIAVTLPKPMTSGLEARGRFGIQDFVYLGVEDVYRPQAMRQRRETGEHPFGTLKMRMGATHFLMKLFQRSPPRWRCMSWPTISPAS
jgi:hypothetical protein